VAYGGFQKSSYFVAFALPYYLYCLRLVFASEYFWKPLYGAKFAKFYGAIQTTNTTTSHIRAHTYEFGVSVPVTPVSSILAEWAMTRKAPSGAQNTTRNTGAIAYDYFLSKRTDVYVVYMADKLSRNALGNTFGVGVQHKF
jgi:predicted porin